MSAALQADDQPLSDEEILQRGVDLLGQQIWCWGRDILRAEGNWLLEIGFDRIAAPADYDRCSSVYTLPLPHGRRVLLRGFGVFYGDDRLGGVFLPRYEFRPQYSADATLQCPPWSADDLPKLGAPTDSQRDACVSLTSGVLDWIHSYENAVAQRLGVEYRRSTLESWNNGKRPLIPADEMAEAWRSLAASLAANPRALIPGS